MLLKESPWGPSHGSWWMKLYFQLLFAVSGRVGFSLFLLVPPFVPKTEARHAGQIRGCNEAWTPKRWGILPSKTAMKRYIRIPKQKWPWTCLHWYIFPATKQRYGPYNKQVQYSSNVTDRSKFNEHEYAKHTSQAPNIYYLPVRCCSLNSTMSRLEKWNAVETLTLLYQNCRCAVEVKDMINP